MRQDYMQTFENSEVRICDVLILVQVTSSGGNVAEPASTSTMDRPPESAEAEQRPCNFDSCKRTPRHATQRPLESLGLASSKQMKSPCK